MYSCDCHFLYSYSHMSSTNSQITTINSISYLRIHHPVSAGWPLHSVCCIAELTQGGAVTY